MSFSIVLHHSNPSHFAFKRGLLFFPVVVLVVVHFVQKVIAVYTVLSFDIQRAKLISRMRSVDGVPTRSMLLFRGGISANRDETDHEPVFRQESTFHYLFGVREPDCLATIDLETEKATVYIPRLPAEYATWMGRILPPSHFQVQFRWLYIAYPPSGKVSRCTRYRYSLGGSM